MALDRGSDELETGLLMNELCWGLGTLFDGSEMGWLIEKVHSDEREKDWKTDESVMDLLICVG